jgi:hypothetical protein
MSPVELVQQEAYFYDFGVLFEIEKKSLQPGIVCLNRKQHRYKWNTMRGSMTYISGRRYV